MNVISPPIDVLYAKLGDKVKENIPLAPYTSARIGGPADVLITVDSADELARAIKLLWKLDRVSSISAVTAKGTKNSPLRRHCRCFWIIYRGN